MNAWKCKNCEEITDEMSYCAPDVCECGSTEFEPVEPIDLIDDIDENKHDMDYLAGR